MTNKEFFINSWQHESGVSAKAIRSLPNDMNKLNTPHHPRFRSPWELVNHFGPHGKELLQAAVEGKSDLVNEGKFAMDGPTIYRSPEEAAKSIEDFSAKLVEALKNVDDNTWQTKVIPVYWNNNKLFEMPLMNYCWIMHNDVIHHRGQLSSYYRVLGVKQPNLYGPTLEDEEAMMAAHN